MCDGSVSETEPAGQFTPASRTGDVDDTCGAYSDCVMLTKVIDSLPLWCGCVASVRRHPATGETTSRTVARQGGGCPNPEHRPGARVWLIELLPERRHGSERDWQARTTG